MSGVHLKTGTIPESSHILLLVLDRMGEINTELKLQKLVFQVQNEAKITGGYPYFKHHYGPYSRELHLDALTLANQEFIKHEVVVGLRYSYSKYNITDRGRTYFRQFVLPGLKQRDITRMSQVLDKYGDYTPHDLAETVYKQWRIKEPEAISHEVSQLLGSLNSVKAFWDSLYLPECFVINYYLAFAEYSLDALSRAASSRDTVVRSVLVHAGKELCDKLETIADACSKRDECPAEVAKDLCNSTDVSIYEIFEFIEDFCSRNKILQRLSERDVADLMTEEEYGRLMKSFQTPLD